MNISQNLATEEVKTRNGVQAKRLRSLDEVKEFLREHGGNLHIYILDGNNEFRTMAWMAERFPIKEKEDGDAS